jgi:hypothetical protein
MQKIDLSNSNVQYLDSNKVKIGKCTKCKKLESVGWLFEHMAWYRGYCYECHDTTKFIVQPFLKYVPPVSKSNEYVTNGISYAIQK